MKKETRGYVYSIIGAILFGTAGMFIKFAYRTGLDSVTILTVQYIIAVFLMFSCLIVKDKNSLKVSKTELKDLCILGVVGNTFMTVFYYVSFKYLPVAMTTMLLYTYPVIVFLYSCVFKRVRIKKRDVFALMLAFIGCVLTLNLLSGGFDYSMTGVVIGLLSAVFYAFMNIFAENKFENVEPLAVNAYSTLFSLIALCMYKFPTELFNGKIDGSTLMNISILAVACEIVPLTLLYASIRLIGALKVSIINNLEIPTAMLLSFVFLGEKVTLMQVTGAMLVIYAISLLKKS